jgi:hypothetical protein
MRRLAAEHALFGVVPVLFSLWYCSHAVSHHSFAIDFHNAFWPAGQRVLHGVSPYVATSNAAVTHGVAFVYPAAGALLFAVLALLPHTAADVVFTVGSLAAALGTLRLLGVRDWRLYGLTALWPAVTSGWQTANLTLLLVLGVAAAWRLRGRPAACGAMVAVVVSLKVFLWPLGLWLLVSRRYASLAWAIAIGIAINGLAWAVLGFDQIHAYLALVRAVSKVEEATAYTPFALALHLGFAHAAAYAIEIALAIIAAALCVRMGRVGRQGRESSVLLLAIVISLLATPTVWRHYFALLLVPLAISRPRLSAIWLVPMLTYVCPLTSPSLWQLCLLLGSMALVVGVLLRYPDAPELQSTPRPGLGTRRLARVVL